jgi:primosomal protein N' (replication factor Y)
MTARRAAPPRTGRVPAAVLPIARLMVDVPLAHLDRPFDYLVPAELDEVVQPGLRVRVRFSGRLVDAYVLSREAATDHDGRLAFLERTVGAEPVLTPETTALFRAVADRWAGSFVDVVRLGVPARHAAAETKPRPAPDGPPAPVEPAGFAPYRAGPAFLGAVRRHQAARAVWTALPGEDWPRRIAELLALTAAAGRGAVAVVPDARDLARLDAAATAVLGADRHVALSAELGPSERYRRWLAVRRGDVRIAIGTRAAVYAPVADLGLVVVWDDGDDLHVEPRAPYAHVRDVAVLRSSLTRSALLIGGHARTAEAQLLVESGWAHELVADRRAVRAAAPTVQVTGDEFEQRRDPAARTARLSSLALGTARDALAAGRPVLVQVPRQGYAPSVACANDRTPARCAHCQGPLALGRGDAAPACRWCGRPAVDWACPVCGGRRLRAMVVGAVRTAEELGRAFPGTPVRTSGGDKVLATVPDGAAVVVATPGAEPVAPAGYGAALLLDGWALLARPDLRAAEEALRRWLAAAALVRSDGRVVVAADAGIAAVQALVRWDPAGFAVRELAERAALGFPPAVRMAAVVGPPAGVGELLQLAHLPPAAELLGTVPAGDDTERALIRVPRPAGVDLAAALKTAASLRASRKAADPVRIVLDPAEVA